MVGAIVAHLTVLGESPVPATVLLVLTAIIAYVRGPEARPDLNPDEAAT